MSNEKELVCKYTKMPDGFEVDCGDEKKAFCKPLVKGVQMGGSIAGTGVNFGETNDELACHDTNDLKNSLEKKYNQKIRLVQD